MKVLDLTHILLANKKGNKLDVHACTKSFETSFDEVMSSMHQVVSILLIR